MGRQSLDGGGLPDDAALGEGELRRECRGGLGEGLVVRQPQRVDALDAREIGAVADLQQIAALVAVGLDIGDRIGQPFVRRRELLDRPS